MAGSIVQQSYNIDDSGTGYATFATTITGVTAGNTLVAFVGHADDNVDDATSGVATNNGSPTAFTQSGGEARNSGASQSSTVWYLENVSSGSHTVTATMAGGSLQYCRIRVIEVSGLATSSSLEASTEATATTGSPSSGASGSTTSANCFVIGFAQNAFESSPGSTVSAGSGYTLSGSNDMMTIEYKSVSSTGTQTATFTGSAGDRTVHVAAFKESGGGGGGSAKRMMTMGVG